ncbi:hypothetical protein TNCT_422351 [Trichonephila clavata]|uniref:C2H2-type domain-containing protein n=1 Tax=Trichonephila clavata TaxID=2740835 RepID=A0A8X6HKX9_TRICU|nr:hypothetical protein TNCT_422351 [Trichonephila clavata]
MAEAKVNPTEEDFYYSCCRCRMGFRSIWLSFIPISSQKSEFTCVKCGIAFSNGFKVKKSDFDHIYPHPCEICGMRFQNSTQLLYHSYHHTGAWPFKCPFCRMGFTAKSYFERHIATKSFQCSKCSEDFLGTYCPARPFSGNDMLSCEKCSSGSKSV